MYLGLSCIENWKFGTLSRSLSISSSKCLNLPKQLPMKYNYLLCTQYLWPISQQFWLKSSTTPPPARISIHPSIPSHLLHHGATSVCDVLFFGISPLFACLTFLLLLLFLQFYVCVLWPFLIDCAAFIIVIVMLMLFLLLF